MKRNITWLSLLPFTAFLAIGIPMAAVAAPPRGSGPTPEIVNDTGKKNTGKKNTGDKKRRSKTDVAQVISDALTVQSIVNQFQFDAYKLTQKAVGKVSDLQRRISDARKSKFVATLEEEELTKLDSMPQRSNDLYSMLMSTGPNDVFAQTFESLESDLMTLEEKLLKISREDFEVWTHGDFSLWGIWVRDVLVWLVSGFLFILLFRRVDESSSKLQAFLDKMKKP